jgi:hypothetical protein
MLLTFVAYTLVANNRRSPTPLNTRGFLCDQAMDVLTSDKSAYLPDELLLEILAHFDTWDILERQTVLARFSAVNR